MSDLETEKILCVGGSTLNPHTLEHLTKALMETHFLEEWAIIFTNHLYFLTYIQQVKSEIKYLNKASKKRINVTRKSDRCTRFGSSRHNSGNNR